MAYFGNAKNGLRKGTDAVPFPSADRLFRPHIVRQNQKAVKDSGDWGSGFERFFLGYRLLPHRGMEFAGTPFPDYRVLLS